MLCCQSHPSCVTASSDGVAAMLRAVLILQFLSQSGKYQTCQKSLIFPTRDYNYILEAGVYGVSHSAAQIALSTQSLARATEAWLETSEREQEYIKIKVLNQQREKK